MTRAADLAQISVTDQVFDDAQGTLAVAAEIFQGSGGGAFAGVGAAIIAGIVGAAWVAIDPHDMTVFGTGSSGGLTRMAVRWDGGLGELAGSVDGDVVQTGSYAAPWGDSTDLRLGGDGAPAIWLRQLSICPTPRTDDDLRRLSA